MNILKPLFILCWFVGAMIRPEPEMCYRDNGEQAKIGSYQSMMTMGDWHFYDKFLSDLASASAKHNRDRAVWAVQMAEVEFGCLPDGTVIWRRKK